MCRRWIRKALLASDHDDLTEQIWRQIVWPDLNEVKVGRKIPARQFFPVEVVVFEGW